MTTLDHDTVSAVADFAETKGWSVTARCVRKLANDFFPADALSSIPEQGVGGVATVALVPDNRIIYGINQWIDEHKPDPELGYADSESEALYAFIIELAAFAPSQPAAVGVTDEMAGLRMWARTMRGVAADGDGLTLTDGQVKALLRNIEAALRSTP